MRAVATSRYVVFLAIALTGCAVDLASKQWVFGWLGMPVAAYAVNGDPGPNYDEDDSAGVGVKFRASSHCINTSTQNLFVCEDSLPHQAAWKQVSPYWIWPGVFGFQTSLNEGALFGMGQGMVVVFSTLSVLAAVGIVYWLFVSGAAEDWFLTVALAGITAGILGNLYDRVGLPGMRWDATHPPHHVGDHVHAVRDWILLMIGKYQWPTFNLADSLLVCGAALLLWHAFRSRADEAAAADANLQS